MLEPEYREAISLAHRKKFAQFFTPELIAELMVNWILDGINISTILEPAFGLGIFSRLLLQRKKELKITGFEIDSVIFKIARNNFKSSKSVQLWLEDYLLHDWETQYDGIICNPPYFKFHDYDNKQLLKEIQTRLKIKLSGFTNLYTLFLLKSIKQIKNNGRIAYLIPSEFLNSDYGKSIKAYLLKANILRYLVIIDFKETVFNDALTTSAILLLAKDSHPQKISFLKINYLAELESIQKNIKQYPYLTGDVVVKTQDINCKQKWRMYYEKASSQQYQNLIPFHTVAKVMRGIATGANDYFVFNHEKAQQYGIDEQYLLPCITKSKDIKTPFFTETKFKNLVENNGNIFLLNCNHNPTNQNILNYLKIGEKSGINQRYLTSKRNPWFALENRPPAPILVGVFNRKGLKFIRNEAEIRNLTTFHCIYLQENLFNSINIDLLFAYLLTDIAKNIFNDNRREYGDGLKKFEPNDLNQGLMLDLTQLKENKQQEILSLFYHYRTSVITDQEDISFIHKIEVILEEEYRKY